MPNNNGSLELEFDLRQSRLEAIGKVVNNVRIKQLEAEKNRDFETISEYHSALKSLYMEVIPYTEAEVNNNHPAIGTEDEENIMDQVNTILKKTDPRKENGRKLSYFMDKLREADNKLNRKRIDLGLDIPQKARVEEGKKLVE